MPGEQEDPCNHDRQQCSSKGELAKLAPLRLRSSPPGTRQTPCLGTPGCCRVRSRGRNRSRLGVPLQPLQVGTHLRCALVAQVTVFLKQLLMISSSFGGTSEFSLTGATGARFRIASKITADVSPRKGTAPVDIS